MRGGFAKLPNALAELLCFGDELGAVDGALLVHAVGAGHAALFAALVAVEESAQGDKRTVELVAVGVCHRKEVVEPLVREIRIDDHRAVDERLELGADRVEIDGRGEKTQRLSRASAAPPGERRLLPPPHRSRWRSCRPGPHHGIFELSRLPHDDSLFAERLSQRCVGELLSVHVAASS